MTQPSVLNVWILCGLVVGSVVGAQSSVVVETPFGKLQGKEVTAPNKQTYFSFTAIPYAKPPVGPLRFAKPEPHPPLDGIFDATQESTHCPHPAGIFFPIDPPPQDEDCLLLDVFLKHLPDGKQQRKVLVWIHGGGFVVGGAADYPAGTFVTTQDVIVVAINYRIGLLGFLSTGDEAAPGNSAVWDQLMAIRWVKDNIAAFGGDPDDITIAGESAGAASVAMLSITPYANGLFTKVFPMSCTSTSQFGLAPNPHGHAVEIARTLGCLEGDDGSAGEMSLSENQKLIECLRERPWQDLAKLSRVALDNPQSAVWVDKDFFPKHPADLIKDQSYLESIGFLDRTYLIGIDNNERTMTNEGVGAIYGHAMSLEDKSDEEKNAIFNAILARLQDYNIRARLKLPPAPQASKTVERVKSWYRRRYGSEGVATAELLADMNFYVPAFDYAHIAAKSRKTDAYLFYFNHFPSFMKDKYRGMGHATDLLFWFDMPLSVIEDMVHSGVKGGLDEDDLEMKILMSDMVGQFVKTGNPWNGLKEVIPGGWPAFDIQGNHYLDLSLHPVVARHLLKEKQEFWLETAPTWALQDAAADASTP